MKKDFIYNVYFEDEGYDFREIMENILLNYIKKTINVNENFIESFNLY